MVRDREIVPQLATNSLRIFLSAARTYTKPPVGRALLSRSRQHGGWPGSHRPEKSV